MTATKFPDHNGKQSRVISFCSSGRSPVQQQAQQIGIRQSRMGIGTVHNGLDVVDVIFNLLGVQLDHLRSAAQIPAHQTMQHHQLDPGRQIPIRYCLIPLPIDSIGHKFT